MGGTCSGVGGRRGAGEAVGVRLTALDLAVNRRIHETAKPWRWQGPRATGLGWKGRVSPSTERPEHQAQGDTRAGCQPAGGDRGIGGSSWAGRLRVLREAAAEVRACRACHLCEPDPERLIRNTALGLLLCLPLAACLWVMQPHCFGV